MGSPGLQEFDIKLIDTVCFVRGVLRHLRKGNVTSS